jgi:DNA-binding LytR/AlgR family response regulator
MRFSLILDKEKDEEVIVYAHSANELTAKIEKMVMEESGEGGLYVYTEDEIKRIDISDIECITIIDRKVYVICDDGKKYRTNRRLCDIEPGLPSYLIRIIKSSIANENRIKSYKTAFSGAVDAIFQCGYKEYVSRRCFANIKRRYDI